MAAGRGLFRPRLVFSAAARAPEPDAVRLARDQADRFRETVLPHMDAAYNFARYLARDPTAAEDIVQEAFLKAFRGFHTYADGGVRPWLLAIVRNCFLDWIKANPRAESGEDDRVDNDHPEALLLRRRDVEIVRRTVGNLPEPFRETLVLRELEELSYKEIAALTGAPIGTVMSRLARAREMLGALLLPGDGRMGEVTP